MGPRHAANARAHAATANRRRRRRPSVSLSDAPGSFTIARCGGVRTLLPFGLRAACRRRLLRAWTAALPRYRAGLLQVECRRLSHEWAPHRDRRADAALASARARRRSPCGDHLVDGIRARRIRVRRVAVGRSVPPPCPRVSRDARGRYAGADRERDRVLAGARRATRERPLSGELPRVGAPPRRHGERHVARTL